MKSQLLFATILFRLTLTIPSANGLNGVSPNWPSLWRSLAFPHTTPPPSAACVRWSSLAQSAAARAAPKDHRPAWAWLRSSDHQNFLGLSLNSYVATAWLTFQPFLFANARVFMTFPLYTINDNL